MIANFLKNCKNFFVRGWFSFFCFLFGSEFVNDTDEDENTECYDEKVDDVLNENAVAQMCGAAATKEIRDGEFKIGEINAAEKNANDWHDEIIDQRTDDFVESATNNDTDG